MPHAFDLSRLDVFTGKDPTLRRELLNLYLESAMLYLERLERALDGDEDWGRTAHALKGASANIGAEAMAACAAQAEDLLASSAMLERLQLELARFRSAAEEAFGGEL